MTQIPRIKAEVERQYKSIESATGDYAEGRRAELRNILSFIESLGQEQIPTEEEMLAMLRMEYEKGWADALAESADSPKIKGWVARDSDENLYLYNSMPERGKNEWLNAGLYLRNNSLFPDLKWEDEPIEVELTFRKV